MSSPINKQTLEHLAKLARIELNAKEEEKILKDLGGILGHFEELRKLDTSKVAPLTGGSELKNVFREDPIASQGDNGASENTNKGVGVEQFPESRDGFLKVLPVFSAEGGSAPNGE